MAWLCQSSVGSAFSSVFYSSFFLILLDVYKRQLQTFSIQGFQTSRTLYLMRRQKSLMSEAALDFWEFTMDYYHAKE